MYDNFMKIIQLSQHSILNFILFQVIFIIFNFFLKKIFFLKQIIKCTLLSFKAIRQLAKKAIHNEKQTIHNLYYSCLINLFSASIILGHKI